MKVIDVIKNMQAAIDALSHESADTEVMFSGALTGEITVTDGDTGPKVTMLAIYNFDFTVMEKPESGGLITSSQRGRAIDWFKINYPDKVTKKADGGYNAGKPIVPFDPETHEKPLDWRVTLKQHIDGVAQKTWLAKHEDLHRRYAAECARTREEPRNYTSRIGEDSEFARDMGWTEREDDS